MSDLILCSYRNLQKKVKKARYEKEKEYMENMRVAGCTVGEYLGDGQGESESAAQEPTSVNLDVVDAEPEVDDQPVDEDEDSSDDAHPLLIFYDCETTGFSIYDDHLTDIAAKVVACPVPLSTPTFSSLVMTSRHIKAPGTALTYNTCTHLQ